MSNIITGRQLRAARILAGLTQKQLAKAVIRFSPLVLIVGHGRSAGCARHRRRMPLEAEFDTRPSERKSNGSAIGTARVQPPPHGEGNPRARGLQP